MARGFAAGVAWGLLVSGAALVTASLLAGDLPGDAAPGAAQVTIRAVPPVGAVPDPAPEAALDPAVPDADAPAIEGAAPPTNGSPPEVAPGADPPPLAPEAAAAPTLDAPGSGAEDAGAPSPGEGGTVVERTVPVLPGAPEDGG